jgi:hypothetical protein
MFSKNQGKSFPQTCGQNCFVSDNGKYQENKLDK